MDWYSIGRRALVVLVCLGILTHLIRICADDPYSPRLGQRVERITRLVAALTGIALVYYLLHP